MIVALLIIFSYIIFSMLILNIKRGETLFIFKEKDVLNFVLRDDLYISMKIKEDKDIFEYSKELLALRAFELSPIVSNVVLVNEDANKNSELLSILKSS